MKCRKQVKELQKTFASSGTMVAKAAALKGKKYDNEALKFFAGYLPVYSAALQKAYQEFKKNFETHRSDEDIAMWAELDKALNLIVDNLSAATANIKNPQTLEAIIEMVRSEYGKLEKDDFAKKPFALLELKMVNQFRQLRGVERRKYDPEKDTDGVRGNFWPNGMATVTEKEILAVYDKSTQQYIPVEASDPDYFIKGQGWKKIGKNTKRWWIPRLPRNASGDEIREYALNYGDKIAMTQLGIDLHSIGGDFGHNGRMAFAAKKCYGSKVDRYIQKVKEVSDEFDRILTEKNGYSYFINSMNERVNFFVENGERQHFSFGNITPYDLVDYGVSNIPTKPHINVLELEKIIYSIHRANFSTIYGEGAEERRAELMREWDDLSLKEQIAKVISPEVADKIEQLLNFDAD